MGITQFRPGISDSDCPPDRSAGGENLSENGPDPCGRKLPGSLASEPAKEDLLPPGIVYPYPELAFRPFHARGHPHPILEEGEDPPVGPVKLSAQCDNLVFLHGKKRAGVPPLLFQSEPEARNLVTTSG